MKRTQSATGHTRTVVCHPKKRKTIKQNKEIKTKITEISLNNQKIDSIASEARPNTREIDTFASETCPNTPETHTFASETRPNTSESNTFAPVTRPSTPETDTFASETYSNTREIHTTTSETSLNRKNQIHDYGLNIIIFERKRAAHNIRYISGGKDAQLERFTIPIKFVTAENNAVPNAARNIPSPLPTVIKDKENYTDKSVTSRLDCFSDNEFQSRLF